MVFLNLLLVIGIPYFLASFGASCFAFREQPYEGVPHIIPRLYTNVYLLNEAPEHVVADDVAPEDVVFGGGPKDKSVLTKYVDHMACKLWDSLVYQ